MKQKLIWLVAFSVALSVFSAEYYEYYVDASRPDNSGSGTNWVTAKQTIQAAVDLTADGDIVWVANGTYLLSSEILVTNAVTVRSVNGSDVTIVDGGGRNRCFTLSGPCLISGVTIKNGSSGDGAGIFCNNMSPIVSNCIISANTAHTARGSYGGGMYRGNAYNCMFTSNDACYGGGVAYGVTKGCVFSNNTATTANLQHFGHGGGQYKGKAYQCSFIKNSAYLSGGGMSLGTASSCLFLENSAGGGGGLSSGSAANCTFIGNLAGYGGGMDEGSVGGTFSLAHNCVFSGNTAEEEGNNFLNSQVYYSCAVGLTNGVDGNITNAPLFVDAADGDFRLMSNSPCINWGNNSVVTNSTDLDGNPRIVEDTVDMGASEYQGVLGLSDADSDNLPDDWERQFGGNQDPNRMGANAINTIRQAHIAGLDPNDPNSRFLAHINSDSTVWWNATSGRVYSVWCSTNLLSGFQCLETNIPWTVGQFIDDATNAVPQMYYKVDVQLEGQ